jgi:hypothetical protein
MTPDDPNLVEIVPSLADKLLAAGWQAGLSMHVSRCSARIDEAVCREMPCPGRKRSGFSAAAFHLGRRFKIILTGEHCGAETDRPAWPVVARVKEAGKAQRTCTVSFGVYCARLCSEP